MTADNWTVFVDDNFHYMDEDERYKLGTFDSYSAAVAACKKIVDEFLQHNTAKTADELYDQYIAFGEDPWIQGTTPPSEAQQFSAWDYARQRCNEVLP